MEWVVPVSSAVIAIAALFVAVRQGVVTRRHNRISVTPHLVIIQKVTPQSPQVDTRLKNYGVGPAVISEVTVLVDGEKLDNIEEAEWPKILSRVGLKYRYAEVSLPNLTVGSFVPIGHDESLLMIDLGDEEQETFDLINHLKRIDIRIRYKSVYGDPYEAHIT